MARAHFIALLASAALAACAANDMNGGQSASTLAPPAPATPVVTTESVLASAIANPARREQHSVRDVYRNPAETLAFFGLKPGMTVIEISPGSGYYAEILAPFAKATGGKYIATGNPIAAISDASVWGEQTYVAFGRDSGPLVDAGSADMVLTFRNVHNWMWQDGMLDKAFGDFAAALKPGGVLGVVEHRADPRPEVVVGGRAAGDGYVAKATIVAAAERAGLVLEAESEINANPKDTKDHPFGVWTLPPNSRGPQAGATPPEGWNPATYTAIGESDRQTLRFRKPA